MELLSGVLITTTGSPVEYAISIGKTTEGCSSFSFVHEKILTIVSIAINNFLECIAKGY